MSEIDVFEALATCYWALSATAPPGMAIVGAYPGLRFGVVGGPIADTNRIMVTRMPPETAAADIDAALALLEASPLLSAWIPPDPAPADIADRLLARGFRERRSDDPVPAMVADLDRLPASTELAGVQILRATTRDHVDTANRVLADGFGAPPEVGQFFADLSVDEVLRPDSQLRTFLVLLDDRPAATALGIVHGGVLGIYSVATIPDARGRGLGREVVLTLMEDAARRGARHAVLESSPMGRPVYARLGFETAGLYRILIRKAGDEEPTAHD